MLAAIGFLTIAVFLAAVLSGRVSVLLALTVVPAAAAVVAGMGGGLGDYVTSGLETVAPVAIMITFAILYFSLMLDTGLFDPAIRRVVRWAGGDPLKICVGTAALTVLVALDGDGASTFLIMVSAMLPLYDRLGMRRIVLAALICLGAGVMNMLPWGGPTARAMAALDLGAGQVFVPLLPAMGAGIAWVLVAAWFIGRRERARLGVVTLPTDDAPDTADAPGAATAPAERSRADRVRFGINLVLTLALVVVLLLQLADLPVAFLCAFVIALLVNRPTWAGQRALFEKHGHNVVLVTTMIFAAGVFTGVLGETGMITAMAQALVGLIPDGAGGMLPVAVALTSMPLSLVFTPDAYYFGILPVLAEASAALGGDPAEVARAALLGQMTTGFPLSPLTASTFILLGLTAVELGRHQRFVFGWAFGTTVVMTVVALLTGALTV